MIVPGGLIVSPERDWIWRGIYANTRKGLVPWSGVDGRQIPSSSPCFVVSTIENGENSRWYYVVTPDVIGWLATYKRDLKTITPIQDPPPEL